MNGTNPCDDVAFNRKLQLSVDGKKFYKHLTGLNN